jgi:hypothetical protein
MCATCLFRKYGLRIGRVAAINLDLLEKGIAFCVCHYVDHASLTPWGFAYDVVGG